MKLTVSCQVPIQLKCSKGLKWNFCPSQLIHHGVSHSIVHHGNNQASGGIIFVIAALRIQMGKQEQAVCCSHSLVDWFVLNSDAFSRGVHDKASKRHISSVL